MHLADAWAKQVAAHPEKKCIEEQDGIVCSHADLDAWAEDLKNCLSSVADAFSDSEDDSRWAVALCVGQGLAEAVCLIACLKAGLPWLPLPAGGVGAADSAIETLASKAGLACSTLMCTHDSETLARTICPRNVALIRVNRDGTVNFLGFAGEQKHSGVSLLVQSSLNAPKRAPAGVKPFAADVLYIMRTSGSTTGVPKFVQGRESSTLHRLRWQWRALPFGSNAVSCRRSPLVFVDSVAEILGTLLVFDLCTLIL